jgi:predicted DNA-binding transcriptional regulator YafY
VSQEIAISLATTLRFAYRNWSGRLGTRHVRPISIRYGSSKWHPSPQWLMLADDLEKGEQREFAMRDMAGVTATHAPR